MDNTMYLAKVFGLYFIIGGVVVMVRRSYFMPVVGGFVKERMLRMIWGSIELLAGLFLVLAHNDWSSLVAGIVSLMGWACVLEGTFYLAAPDSVVDWIIKKLNVPAWYIGGGLVTALGGVYLVGMGFGWM